MLTSLRIWLMQWRFRSLWPPDSERHLEEIPAKLQRQKIKLPMKKLKILLHGLGMPFVDENHRWVDGHDLADSIPVRRAVHQIHESFRDHEQSFELVLKIIIFDKIQGLKRIKISRFYNKKKIQDTAISSFWIWIQRIYNSSNFLKNNRNKLAILTCKG